MKKWGMGDLEDCRGHSKRDGVQGMEHLMMKIEEVECYGKGVMGTPRDGAMEYREPQRSRGWSYRVIGEPPGMQGMEQWSIGDSQERSNGVWDTPEMQRTQQQDDADAGDGATA